MSKGHWHRKTKKSILDREIDIRWALATLKISEKEKLAFLEELEKLTTERYENERKK